MAESHYTKDIDSNGDGTEQWCLRNSVGSNSNLLHRLDGPAYIRYTGWKITSEAWFQDGKYYRPGGLPDHVMYSHWGVVTRDSWMNNRRPTSPSKLVWIDYGEDGDEFHEMWYHKGVAFDINDLADYIKLSKEDKVLIKLVYG